MALQLCLEGPVVEGWVEGVQGLLAQDRASEGPYPENYLIYLLYLILLVRVFPREGPPFQREGLLGGGSGLSSPPAWRPPDLRGKELASGRRAGAGWEH